MSELKSKPPGSRSKSNLDSFIDGAELRTSTTSSIDHQDDPYPWQLPGVRDDVLKVYNIRLTEPYLLKLKFIAENTPGSMQRFCTDILKEAIDAKIESLTK